MRLRMFGFCSGFSSETFDFAYVCMANGKEILGGRFTYWLLGWFTNDKQSTWFEYDFQSFQTAVIKEKGQDEAGLATREEETQPGPVLQQGEDSSDG